MGNYWYIPLPYMDALTYPCPSQLTYMLSLVRITISNLMLSILHNVINGIPVRCLSCHTETTCQLWPVLTLSAGVWQGHLLLSMYLSHVNQAGDTALSIHADTIQGRLGWHDLLTALHVSFPRVWGCPKFEDVPLGTNLVLPSHLRLGCATTTLACPALTQ